MKFALYNDIQEGIRNAGIRKLAEQACSLQIYTTLCDFLLPNFVDNGQETSHHHFGLLSFPVFYYVFNG